MLWQQIENWLADARRFETWVREMNHVFDGSEWIMFRQLEFTISQKWFAAKRKFSVLQQKILERRELEGMRYEDNSELAFRSYRRVTPRIYRGSGDIWV